LDRAYRRGVVLSLIGALAVFVAGVEHRQAAPAVHYVDIELLLDNSPSMAVGATPGDVAAMMYLTPCSEAGAMFQGRSGFGRRFGGMSASGQVYAAYSCGSRGGNQYDGKLACPVRAAQGVADTPVMVPGGFAGPRCVNLPERTPPGWPAQFAKAGAPCAFACHWDISHPAGAGNDYFGVARRTIGQRPCYEAGADPGACAITLRSDFVKTAVSQALAAMRDGNATGDSLFAAGVFTFDTHVHAVYPSAGACRGAGCAAGDDWAAAIGSVGLPAVVAGAPDTGIQASAMGNGPGATDFPAAFRELAARSLSPAGEGDSPNTARKALVLVTDGLDDHVDGERRRYGAIDPALCDIYKSIGYTVFVLYTPYIPQMNPFYLFNIKQIVEAAGPGSAADGMRRCASDSALDFFEADPSDPASIAHAMRMIVNRAASL
jgi:hypothetical protein